MNKKVAIIIPVYNGEQYLPDCIESILKQDYPHKELIVIEDCSPDNSRQIATELAQKHNFRLVKNRHNLGLARTLNKGISLANNPDYLFILQNDCILQNKNYLTKMLDILEQNKDIGALTGQGKVHDVAKLSLVEKLNILLYLSDVVPSLSFPQKRESLTLTKEEIPGSSPRMTSKKLAQVNFIEGRADMYRFPLLKKLGGFDSNLHMAGEDQVLSIKIQRAGYKLAQNRETFYYLGFGGNQNSYWKILKHSWDIAQVAPYVMRNFGSSLLDESVMTKNRFLRKKLRFQQCWTLLWTGIIFALAVVNIHFLWLLLPLWLWRIWAYQKQVYHCIELNWQEGIIYWIMGILGDYFYSLGFVRGVLLNKKAKIK